MHGNRFSISNVVLSMSIGCLIVLGFDGTLGFERSVTRRRVAVEDGFGVGEIELNDGGVEEPVPK